MWFVPQEMAFPLAKPIRLGSKTISHDRTALHAAKAAPTTFCLALTAWLVLSASPQGAGLKALLAAKESLATSQINRTSAVVGATLNKLAAALAQLQELGSKLAQLPEDAAAEGAAEGEEKPGGRLLRAVQYL